MNIAIASREEFESAVSGLPEGSRSESEETPYGPELDDLYFLYCWVRETCAVAVMEFGTGWSTYALARGINENRKFLAARYQIRHPNPFRLLSIDASTHWQELALSRLPSAERNIVDAVSSTPRLTTQFGGVGSLFENIPPFTPDLVYLDAPDPEQVQGRSDGFYFQEVHGLPMSVDLLRLEPHLWPGTQIVTDGRTANARFLIQNFKRPWQSLHDAYGDRTLMLLAETPFGPISEDHQAFRLLHARALRQKEGAVPLGLPTLD